MTSSVFQCEHCHHWVNAPRAEGEPKVCFACAPTEFLRRAERPAPFAPSPPKG